MWKIIWEKLNQVLGERVVLIVIGGLIMVYAIYHGQQYVMTKQGFAVERVKITGEIQTVCKDSKEADLLIEYKVLEMEEARVQQQQWALEDRLEQTALSPSMSQQSRMYQMEKQLDEIRQRKIEIQKQLRE